MHRPRQRRSPERSSPPSDFAGQSPWVRLRSHTYHPFIFEKMIDAADRAARPGDVVNVYDRAGALFGKGLFNPRSQIAVRMLTHADEPIDDAFWRRRLAAAVELRRMHALDEVTDAYRLVHAEGDGLSGLVVERYGDWLVCELFSLGMYERAAHLTEMLAQLLGPPKRLDRPAGENWQILLRADEEIERIEGFQTQPQNAPAELVIREHGVRYRVDVAGGHKTGFFCDQRDNRRHLATLCSGANVLDLCCYSGGFGLCALRLGGARSVTAVDLDESAIALARDNANLNQVRIDFAHADAFVYLRQMLALQRRFEVCVLDPPKLATSRQGIDEALHRYHDLNRLALQVVQPGGVLLTCSCSGLVNSDMFREVVHRAARAAGRPAQLLAQTGAGPDHPVQLGCPESQYLKALWLRVG